MLECLVRQTSVLNCVITLLKRSSPGEEGQGPVLLLVPKDLGHVLAEAQREAVLIGAGPEDRGPEGL